MISCFADIQCQDKQCWCVSAPQCDCGAEQGVPAILVSTVQKCHWKSLWGQWGVKVGLVGSPRGAVADFTDL